jgi:3',5'-cyclic AMP phosphodiesterase CpdA
MGATGLLQISDPHFGTEVPQVVEALRALTAELAPSLVVMSGDITQRATEEQFRLASAFLRQLPAPASLVVPGNHDVPLMNLALRALSPFSRFNKAFGRELEPVHDDAHLLVIGVNTVMPIWHQQGAVSMRQTERICRLLQQATPEQVRVVVCHHPVHVIRPEDDKNLLRGAADAVPRWVAAGADLVLGGHIHLPYFRPLKHRFPNLPRAAWVAQAGTAVSSRIRSGICNSVNYVQPLATGNGASCRVERWDYSERLDAFRRIAAEELALDRGPASSG